ncbi:MAG: glycosyltransferase [Candidatus Thorarchaeota archaeon]
MTRVAILSPLPPQKTGESEYTLRLIQALTQQSTISILAITGEGARELADSNGKVETLRIWNGRSPLYPFRIFQKLKQRSISLFHAQFGPHGKVYGGLFGEFMLLLLLLLRLGGIKTTVTLHSTWMPHQVRQRVRTYKKIGRFALFAQAFFSLFMKLLDLGTNTIQLSTAKMDSSLRKGFLQAYGIHPEKVLEIPHPCAPHQTHIDVKGALHRLRLAGKEVILVFGYVRRAKGLEYAIRAMPEVKRNIPNSFLLIVGAAQNNEDAKYLGEMTDLVSELDIEESVRFVSEFIQAENVEEYFSAASVILVPYTESVGASGPIHNYASYGIPIIASDVGLHNRESLGGNLILFETGNSDDLAGKITLAITNDPLRGRIQEAYQTYAHLENWDLAAKRTLVYYRKTVTCMQPSHTG